MNSSSITPAIENACIASPRGLLRTAEMDVRALFMEFGGHNGDT
jgi:hypothetical protein